MRNGSPRHNGKKQRSGGASGGGGSSGGSSSLPEEMVRRICSKLSAAAYCYRGGVDVAAHFRRMDKNHDGVLSYVVRCGVCGVCLLCVVCVCVRGCVWV